MEVIKAIKIDEEERNTLKNAMLIIEAMRNKTDDPLLEKLMKDFEPLAKCLNNGSVWMQRRRKHEQTERKKQIRKRITMTMLLFISFIVNFFNGSKKSR